MRARAASTTMGIRKNRIKKGFKKNQNRKSQWIRPLALFVCRHSGGVY